MYGILQGYYKVIIQDDLGQVSLPVTATQMEVDLPSDTTKSPTTIVIYGEPQILPLPKPVTVQITLTSGSEKVEVGIQDAFQVRLIVR